MSGVDLGFLAFLTEPWFVIPWYGLGLFLAGWAVWDAARRGASGPRALAWGVVALFLAPLGLALYLAARPGGPRQAPVASAAALSLGAVTLGLVAATLAARLLGLDLWPELALGYLAGVALGALVLARVTPRAALAAPLVGLSVTLGASAAGGLVAPALVGAQPPPTTYAFWGLTALGLSLALLCALPMSWALVGVGWLPGPTAAEVRP